MKSAHSISYSYYENPYIFISETDFANEFGVEYMPLYEQFLSEHKKNSATPIRYDFYPGDYTPGLHPVSHIHNWI